MHITGVPIGYYFHCKWQLWLFAHSLQMEQENENVAIGKLVSQTSYPEEKHEIDITDELEKVGLKIDFFDAQTNTIHEIKKSNSFEIAHVWQLLYYIMFSSKKASQVSKANSTTPVSNAGKPLF